MYKSWHHVLLAQATMEGLFTLQKNLHLFTLTTILNFHVVSLPLQS